MKVAEHNNVRDIDDIIRQQRLQAEWAESSCSGLGDLAELYKSKSKVPVLQDYRNMMASEFETLDSVE